MSHLVPLLEFNQNDPVKRKPFLKQNEWKVLQAREVGGLFARERVVRREQHHQRLLRHFLPLKLVRYRKHRDRKFNFARQQDFFQAVATMRMSTPG
jgi:hypothetical protein